MWKKVKICPICKGEKVAGDKRCPQCNGTGKVDYNFEVDGEVLK